MSRQAMGIRGVGRGAQPCVPRARLAHSSWGAVPGAVATMAALHLPPPRSVSGRLSLPP